MKLMTLVIFTRLEKEICIPKHKTAAGGVVMYPSDKIKTLHDAKRKQLHSSETYRYNTESGREGQT